MRKKILAIILLAGFVSISFLGFFSMNHKHESSFELHTCLAQTIQGKVCPSGTRDVSSALFHIEAIKSFFVVIFSNIINLAAGLFALIALFIFYLFKKFRLVFLPPLLQNASRAKIFLKNIFFSKEQTLFWSALHEMSPTLS